MRTIVLTNVGIRGLPKPDAGQKTVWDSASPVGVRISQGGSKTFVVMLGSGKRHVIGRYGEVTLADAREAARRLRAEKTLGRIMPASVSLAQARSEYLGQLNVRPNTRLYYERNVNRLGGGKLGDITARDINRVLDQLGPSSRNQALAAIRAFFGWCVRRNYLDRSPCERMTLPIKLQPRDRMLDDSELKAVWNAAEGLGYPWRQFTQLAILLGQRRSELAALRWHWIDVKAKLISFPREIMKGKKPHAIPYGAICADILETVPRRNSTALLFPARRKDDRPISGFSKGKRLLDDKLAIPAFTFHDLRRSMASGWQRCGIRIDVTERYLAHRSGSFAGIVSVYQQHDLIPEMRQAAANWERHLTAVFERPS